MDSMNVYQKAEERSEDFETEEVVDVDWLGIGMNVLAACLVDLDDLEEDGDVEKKLFEAKL
jgi:hypothetical protein